MIKHYEWDSYLYKVSIRELSAFSVYVKAQGKKKELMANIKQTLAWILKSPVSKSMRPRLVVEY